MTENTNNTLEKKDSLNGEVLLDWKEYDDEEEEEEDKNENSQQNEQESYSKKHSENQEENTYDDNYNDTYYKSKGSKDYSYSNGTYKKNYSYYNKGYGYKKYGKKYNKGYDNGYDKGYDNNYYNSNTYYKKWQNDGYGYNNSYKYKEKDNYYEPKKMIEKELDYDTKNEDNKKYNDDIVIDFDKKIDKKNFTSGNTNKFYNKNKNYGYNSRFNKNNLGYSTREFNDDKKRDNKNTKFRRFKEEEFGDKKDEEDIKKPLFYNSKIQGIQETPHYIKLEDYIKFDHLKEDINEMVKETYLNLKSKINKNLEEQYGSLNINAKTYIPKKKMLLDNNNNMMANNTNYGQNYVNNNIFPQNMMPPNY